MSNNTYNYNIEKMLESDLVTDRAKEALLVLNQKGTIVETAIALGIRKRTLQDLLSRANKSMMSEELASVVPDNHMLQGTSTLYKINEDTSTDKSGTIFDTLTPMFAVRTGVFK